MPAVSNKQEKFMRAVAENPKFAKKVGVPQSVGREFTKSGGGMANTSRMNKLEELGRVNAEKAKTSKGKSNLMAEKKRIVGELKEPKGMMKKEVKFMQEKGAPKSMIKHEMKEAGMKKGGMAKYANGGMVAPSKMGAVKTAAPSRDGVAVKGKTKGKMVKMAYGGKAC
jgi:hypothetical protein